MKFPSKFSVIVWVCNITLVFLVVIIGASSYYYTMVPGLVGLDTNFEGASKYSAKISQNFLSDYFTFERVIDREKDIDSESYYFASTQNLYEIPISDSVLVEINKVNSELSSRDFTFTDMQIKTVTVSESGLQLPIRLAAPAIPLTREEYRSLAQKNVLSFILYGIYTFIFVWFLRKFVSGLRKPNFFNSTNSKYLYITAGMVTCAPLLMWASSALFRPDVYSEYLINNGSAINASSSLPTTLFVFGIILLVIAWCFDQGVKLQKEQELTI